MQMALPISRASYALMSLLAYMGIALIIATVASLPLLLLSEYHAG